MTEEIEYNLKNVFTGIYYGLTTFIKTDDKSEKDSKDKEFDQSKVYKSVMSIGFNPYYDN